MPESPTVITLSDTLLVPRAYLFQLRGHLNRGGLCVVPSDTCYALAGIPVIRGVGRDINKILDKGNQHIPVSFGTQNLAERFVEFSRENLQLIDEFTPGPLTLVVPLRRDLPEHQVDALMLALNGDNRSIGIRFPGSPPEIQISSELERPITTSAIFYRDGTPVRNFADALDIVQEAIERHGIDRSTYGIRRRAAIKSGGLSTVVETSPALSRRKGFAIIRPGEVSEKQIRSALAALDRYVARDVEEWT